MQGTIVCALLSFTKESREEHGWGIDEDGFVGGWLVSCYIWSYPYLFL